MSCRLYDVARVANVCVPTGWYPDTHSEATALTSNVRSHTIRAHGRALRRTALPVQLQLPRGRIAPRRTRRTWRGARPRSPRANRSRWGLRRGPFRESREAHQTRRDRRRRTHARSTGATPHAAARSHSRRIRAPAAHRAPRRRRARLCEPRERDLGGPTARKETRRAFAHERSRRQDRGSHRALIVAFRLE